MIQTEIPILDKITVKGKETTRQARGFRGQIHKPPTIDPAVAGKMFLFLYYARVATSTQLCAMFPDRSERKFKERVIRPLISAGYLNVVDIDELTKLERNSSPYNLALGNLGAAWLEDVHGIKQGKRVDWTDKNRKLKSKWFLEHCLMHGRFMLALEEALLSYPRIKLIRFHQLMERAPESTRKDPKKYQNGWKAAFYDDVLDRKQNVFIYPDDIFALLNLDAQKGKKVVAFPLEIDAGTETINPKDVTRLTQSIKRKELQYWDTHLRDLFQSRYGINEFRPLFFTTTAARVEQMIDAQRIVDQPERIAEVNKGKELINGGRGSGLFYFLDQTTLERSAHNLLETAWRNGKTDTPVTMLTPFQQSRPG